MKKIILIVCILVSNIINAQNNNRYNLTEKDDNVINLDSVRFLLDINPNMIHSLYRYIAIPNYGGKSELRLKQIGLTGRLYYPSNDIRTPMMKSIKFIIKPIDKKLIYYSNLYNEISAFKPSQDKILATYVLDKNNMWFLTEDFKIFKLTNDNNDSLQLTKQVDLLNEQLIKIDNYDEKINKYINENYEYYKEINKDISEFKLNILLKRNATTSVINKVIHNEQYMFFFENDSTGVLSIKVDNKCKLFINKNKQWIEGKVFNKGVQMVRYNFDEKNKKFIPYNFDANYYLLNNLLREFVYLNGIWYGSDGEFFIYKSVDGGLNWKIFQQIKYFKKPKIENINH